MGICLVLGTLIELFQHDFQRTPDAGDVLRDVIGGLVGVVFLFDSRKIMGVKILRTCQMAVIGLVGMQIYPVLTALADEYLAREQFPVLSSFETPWEIERWGGNAAYAIDDHVHLEGEHSLRVLLGTGKYSGVNLKYFPENWDRAKRFRFSVFNPRDEVLELVCRINDQQHQQGRQRYADRFNCLYKFPKGWTTVDIDVQDIRTAPQGRLMDMSHIKGVSVFAMDLPKSRVIYIDDVRLVN